MACWKNITEDKFVLDSVSGISLALSSIPEYQFVDSTPNNVEKKDIMTSVVDKLLVERVIEPVKNPFTKRSFCSRLFLRPKKSGSFRPILDLSELNKKVKTKHFKMDHIYNIAPLLQKGVYMGSLDITNAFHSFQIKEKDRNFLQFFFEGKFYRYRCLPNGLAQAPYDFTRIMKVVSAYIKKKFSVGVCIYIDDFFFFHKSEKMVKNALEGTANLLEKN